MMREGNLAPDVILRLAKCNCDGDCQSNLCKCFHQKMPCTDLCHITSDTKCENTDSTAFYINSNLEANDLFDNMKL